MTLLDAPMMPVPVRDAQTSIGGKNFVESCAPAVAGSRKARAAIVPRLRFSPMTQRSFVCAPRLARTHRVKTRPVAKEANEACGVSPASHAECRGRFHSHGLRTGIAVTAAKDRSVWTPRPPVG